MDYSRDYRRRSASSEGSHAASTYSNTNSTRHLVDPANTYAMASSSLDPPKAPYALPTASTTSLSTRAPDAPLLRTDSSSPVSLSVNYLPSKFSSSVLAPGARLRKGKNGDLEMPKRGGGREAFRSSEARMPGEGDDDYDGVNNTRSIWGGVKGNAKRRLRWNRFKWTLFISNIVLTFYSITGLVFCLLTWFDVWTHADVVRVGNRPELIFSTLASSLGVFTCMIGWSGILLNNRSFLAMYTFLLWVCFAFLVTPGYITYKRRVFNLEGKINSEWSRELGAEGRLRIQNQLQCCGYFSPFVEATVSQTCYARSILPGCKKHYFDFEKLVLSRWYIVAFALVPLHIAIIVVGLLCSNHVTYRFGKGMMPEAYRLNMSSMAVIMDNYAR